MKDLILALGFIAKDNYIGVFTKNTLMIIVLKLTLKIA